MAHPAISPRPSEARDRLLRTATSIFYAKGVRSVGVEEILSRAQVTRATFYRHFPGKEDLVTAYLRTADRQIRDAVATATQHLTAPDGGVRAIADMVVQQIRTQGFRGCAFLNAAEEFPDADHQIHRAVLDHRAWFFQAVSAQFARLDENHVEPAEQFVMLRDGAMAEGCLADPDRVSRTFLRAVQGLLAPYHSDAI